MNILVYVRFGSLAAPHHPTSPTAAFEGKAVIDSIQTDSVCLIKSRLSHLTNRCIGRFWPVSF